MSQRVLLVAVLTLALGGCIQHQVAPPDPAPPVAEQAAPESAVDEVGGVLERAPEPVLEVFVPEPVQEPAVELPQTPAQHDELDTELPELSDQQVAAERDRAADHAPTYDVPVEVNEQVLRWVDHYANRQHAAFEKGLIRSGRYLPMIRAAFAEAGVPQDLAYMAHVESGYKPYAYSRAHAKGVMQFISATGRRYGLRIDEWIDERSDTEKAARASAAYLNDLYARFGDWYLALAAYNAGEGRIARALRRTGANDFWSIATPRHLRRETRNYVPAILAVILISKDPGKYGFDFTPADPVVYDTIVVDDAVDLRVVARCAGSDLETLKGLNPALRRMQTAPRRKTSVYVPVGSGVTALAALAEVPQDERVLYAYHRVRSGDTLWDISRRYGVSVSAIQQTNGMGRRTLLSLGRTLKIPTGGAPLGAAPPVALGEPVAYRVRRGDTLSGIAHRYGTSAGAIARHNGLSLHGVLRVGQRLTVPAAGTAVAVSDPTGTHTVRRGDTLWRIADRYRTSVSELCRLNSLSPRSTIYPGTKLRVPAH